MKRWVPLVLSLVLLVAVAWTRDTDAPNPTDAKNMTITTGRETGMRVYIDPVTKEPVDAPAQPDWDIPSMGDDLNLSSEGLIVEDSPVSGKMVNLQGRFRHRYDAGVDADGKLSAACDLPESTRNADPSSEEE